MGVSSPDKMAEAFMRLFNERDAEGLIGLYEPDAVFTMDGAEKAHGHAQITAALNGFFESPLKLRGELASLHQTGDIALARLAWELVTPDGAVHSKGLSAEILRQGADGKWRFVIDDASGGGRA